MTVTAAELRAMIEAVEEAGRAGDELEASRVYHAILNARPTSPEALALLLRWLVGELGCDGGDATLRILTHVAERLEEMGRGEGREP